MSGTGRAPRYIPEEAVRAAMTPELAFDIILRTYQAQGRGRVMPSQPSLMVFGVLFRWWGTELPGKPELPELNCAKLELWACAVGILTALAASVTVRTAPAKQEKGVCRR